MNNLVIFRGNTGVMNRFIWVAFVVVGVLFLWGCTNTSGSGGSSGGGGSSSLSCTGVVCQNGGGCNNGVCVCPTGYTGTNCQTLVPGDILFWTDCSTFDTTGIIKVYIDTAGTNIENTIGHCSSSAASCSDGVGALFSPSAVGIISYKAVANSGRVWRGSVDLSNTCVTVYLHD